MTPELLTELLIQFGPLDAEVRFLKDATGSRRGIAFCDYADARSALYAMAVLDGLEVAGGRRLRANPANSKNRAPPPILEQLQAIACPPRPGRGPPDPRQRRSGEGSAREAPSARGYSNSNSRGGFDSRGGCDSRGGFDPRRDRGPRGPERGPGRDERRLPEKRPRGRSRSPPYVPQRNRVPETRWQPQPGEVCGHSVHQTRWHPQQESYEVVSMSHTQWQQRQEESFEVVGVNQTVWQPQTEEVYEPSMNETRWQPQQDEVWQDPRLGLQQYQEPGEILAPTPQTFVYAQAGSRPAYVHGQVPTYAANVPTAPGQWQGWQDPRLARPSW